MPNLFSTFSGFKDPEHEAIKTLSGRMLRYRDLDQLSARLAGVLCDRGLRPGQRVAVQAEKSIEGLAFYIACLRFGAIYVPMNTAYTVDEATYIINDCKPALLVISDGLSAAGYAGSAHDTGNVAVETLNGPDGSLMSAAAQTVPYQSVYGATDEDIAAILYTSGTTGKPKGAMLSHNNLASNARTLVDAWRFSATDCLLHALPIFHAHGLFVASNVALASGASQIFLSKFNIPDVLAALSEATVFMGVPTFYTRLLNHADFNAQSTQAMRLFTSGSAPLLPSTFEDFEARTGQRILERYGMTETAMNTSNLYDGPRTPGSVGAALKDIHVRIVDAQGASVAAGQTGDVEVKGPNVMAGYWHAEDKTAESFTQDGFFKTGDQGYLDDAGYLFLVGRAKDMIISGGFNVYPIEIEQALNDREDVIETAVIGVPHPDFGEAVLAIVVPRSGYAFDGADAQSKLKQQLANYKLPKRIFERDALPRNTMGKVRKDLLRQDYVDIFNA
ncbi:MAG: AMP-binding protein [Pseudomonadota bacterium]